MDVNRGGGAPAAVAILHVAGSASTLAALLAELEPACTSVILWDAGVSPAKEAESFDVVHRAGFRPTSCIDGEPLASGLAYLAPAQGKLWFQGSCLRVSALLPHERASFDRVLQSLARAWGHRSIVMAPELPGADAERGVQAVRRAGGAVRVPRMPESARAPASSPPCERRSEPGAPASRTAPRSQRSPAPAFRVQRSFPRSPIVLHRLQAAAAVAVQRAASRDRVRAWVPACKTGGLVHAVAMLLCEAIADARTGQRAQVFGTDADEEALALARAGRYQSEVAAGMEPRLRALYVHEDDDGASVRIAAAARDACVFSSHRLPRHAPFCRLDLIVCRRLFEGVAPSQRDDVVSELCGALREGGVLFTLDHVEYFENGCFERASEGYLQPRHPAPARSTFAPPTAARASVAGTRSDSAELPPPVSSAVSSPPVSSPPVSSPPVSSPPVSSPPVSSLPPLPAAEDALGLERLDEASARPLLMLDAELRVVHLSASAMQRFGLSPASRQSPLEVLAPRLPGGGELLQAAERALTTESASECLLSQSAPTYLVRVAPAARGAPGRLTVVFTDVSALEAATGHAVLHRHRQAVVARLGELALRACPIPALCDEALRLLVAGIPRCSAGLIVECRRGEPPLGVAASCGLGPAPLTALRSAGADEPVERVLERCGKGDPHERAEVWSLAPSARPSFEQGAGRGSPGVPLLLDGGAAWPIVSERALLGVIALYSARGGIQALDVEPFVRGVAHVLAAALARERQRQRLELEAAVDAVIASSRHLAALGHGLLRALEASLGAETLEIWWRSDERQDTWQRLFPEAAPAAVDPRRVEPPAGTSPPFTPPWALEPSEPHGLGSGGQAARKRPLFRPAQGPEHAGELWLSVEGRAGKAALIRASGVRLRAPERELEAALEALALRLAPVFERLEPPAPPRSGELLRSRTLAELETLCETLPVGISVYDRLGVARHGLHLSPDAWLARLYADELPRWVARTIDTDEAIEELELSVADGAERRSWRCSIRPLRDDSGVTSGAVAVVHEVAGASALAAASSLAASRTLATERPASFIEPRRRRVLILSADAGDANTLAASFDLARYELTVAVQLDDAARSRHERLDLLLCDIDSPSIDAAAVAEQIRAAGGAGPLGLVALTRDSGALARVRAEEAGFDAYLTQPVVRDTLQACLSRLSAAPSLPRRRR